MRIKGTLSSRERVKLALEHKETDRVPISMICSGFNPPIHAAFFDYSIYPGSIEKLKSGRDIYIILSNAKDMGPIALKSQYGDRLCFEGGICVQKILPFGTEEEVIDETKKLIDVLSKNGGYILGPSHCIQAGTPPENIHGMFETALSYKK